AADIEVYSLACPLFVPLVEEGWTEGVIARMIVERYLAGIKLTGADTLVLGCTHYPLLKEVIQGVWGDVHLVDSAIETAVAVKRLMAAGGLETKADTAG